MLLTRIQFNLRILITLSLILVLTACGGGGGDVTVTNNNSQKTTNLSKASIIIENDTIGQELSTVDLNSSLSTGETVGDTVTVSVIDSTVASTDLITVTVNNGRATIELKQDAQSYLTTNGITAGNTISFQVTLITSENNTINVTLTIKAVVEGITMEDGEGTIHNGISGGSTVFTMLSSINVRNAINVYTIIDVAGKDYAKYFDISNTGVVTVKPSETDLDAIKNQTAILSVHLTSTNTSSKSYTDSASLTVQVKEFAVNSATFTTIWDGAGVEGMHSNLGTVTSNNTTGSQGSYSITGGNALGLFSIDSNSGIISTNGSLKIVKDTEQQLEVSFTVGVYVAYNTITIDIKSLEVGDKFTAIDEDGSVVLGTVSSTNTTGEAISSYRITHGNTLNLFAIDNTGEITVTSNFLLDSKTILIIEMKTSSYTVSGVVEISIHSFSVKDEIVGVSKDVSDNYIVTTVEVRNNTGEAVNSYEITAGNDDSAFSINFRGEITTTKTSMVTYKGQKFTLNVEAKNAQFTSSGIIQINIVGNCYDNASIITTSNPNPLAKCQWYYENDGLNSSFAGQTGNDGIDLDLHAVHTESYNSKVGILGRDIKIAVIDDGLEIAHEDLNADTKYSYNVSTGGTNPTPVFSDDSHGTAVAGIINMQDNTIGGLGVAPDATVYGRNLLGSDADGNRHFVSNSQELYMLGLSENPASTVFTASASIDVYNNSWGTASCSPGTENSFYKTSGEASREGRNDKGNIYVKSAGNGFASVSNCNCSDANNYNTSCQNANEDSYNSLPEFIVTGAFNAKGKSSSYSTHGANLWVSAPGGEYGKQINRVASLSSSISSISNILFKANFLSYFYEPAMVTTDLTGCDKGYSYFKSGSGNYVSSSDFNYSWAPNVLDNFIVTFNSGGHLSSDLNTALSPHALNANCNYNNSMNGTSSAAPATTGVIALMLEVNPDLTNRDVKHILANTSINDTDNELVKREGNIYNDSSTNYSTVIDQGWVTNAAGYRFSNAYGFGLVNAKKAVDMTKTYTANSLGVLKDTNEIVSGAVNKSFEKRGVPVESIINIPTGITPNLIVENVVVRLNVIHFQIGFVKVVLVSPSGTESIIYWPFNSYNTSGNFENTRFLSNAFYGESGQGDWKIKISDIGSSSGTRRLDSWSIQILGH